MFRSKASSLGKTLIPPSIPYSPPPPPPPPNSSSQTPPMAAGGPERPMTRTSSVYTAETAQGTHSFKISMKRGTGGVGTCVTSDTFAVGGHDWRIRCYPKGFNAPSKAYIAIFLDLVSEGADVKVRVLYDFRLLDHATGLFVSVFSIKDLYNAYASKGPWGTDRCLKRNLLGPSYLQDGHFVVECDFTLIRQSLVEDSTVEVQVPPSDLLDDLGKLLVSEEGVDVAFKVKGDVFYAHEIVLVVRSPVFKQLLYGSARENEMKTVTIEDVEPDVFKAMLSFIYTDSLPAMDDLDGHKNEETVWHLLGAAEKYAVERLKLVCVDILCKRLDDKSVVGTLALADKHHSSKVRDACIEFMKRQCPAVYIDILEKASGTRKM